VTCAIADPPPWIGYPNVVTLSICALVGITMAFCCLHAFFARIVPPVAADLLYSDSDYKLSFLELKWIEI